MTGLLRSVAVGALAAMAVGMAVRISLVLLDAPESFPPQLRYKYQEQLTLVLPHGGSGVVALAIGVSQFWASLRGRWPTLHRACGAVYLVAVAMAGVTALPLAAAAYGGVVAQTGFTVLALLWLACSAAAVGALVQRDFSSHGRWMARSYALTFSAVMVRVWQSVFYALELPIETSYALSAWISWIPTVLATELILHLRIPPRQRVEEAWNP